MNGPPLTSALKSLDAALLRAHASNDTRTLIDLYTQAAQSAVDAGARGFYLTHAYVYALEVGAPEAAALRSRLEKDGRI